MNNVIWISWEDHRRTNEICNYLSIKPYVIISSKKSITRYFYLINKTVTNIIRLKPSTLIVQNPSIVLATIAVIMQPLFKYQLIIDAHNEAIQPYMHNNWMIRYVAKLLMRRSKYTIVTNKYLARIVDGHGGRAIILPDRVPQVGEIESIQLAQNTFNIILIATYAADEPISQIIDAACALENKVTLYVTGNFSRLDKSYIEILPSNIVFTGFLTNDDYWSYLKSADAIIDLSLKDNCLVCGAYEGIAVGKPLILSSSKATIEYFNKGVVYTDNTTANIHDCYLKVIQDYEHLSEKISELNNEVTYEWKQQVAKLCQAFKKNKL